MLSLLASIFGSIFAGGATGLLGVLLQKYFDLQTKKLDADTAYKTVQLQIQLRDKEIELARVSAEGQKEVAQVQGDSAVEVEAQKAFAQSVVADRGSILDSEAVRGDRWSVRILVVLEFVRGVVRPILTVALLWMSWKLYLQTDEILRTAGSGLSVEILQSQMLLIVSTVLYLATTVICWWFGVRNAQQPPTLKK